MKIYVKDGVRKTQKQIIVCKDGYQTINPSEEMILADGWVEYVAPELTIEDIKLRKKQEILDFDSSSIVNEFYISGMPVWLDKATRTGLMLRLQSEEALEKTKTTLWYGNFQFELELEKAKQMLYYIEIYASACYDNTQSHIAAVDKLDSIKDIEAYDYHTGYPEKLRF